MVLHSERASRLISSCQYTTRVFSSSVHHYNSQLNPRHLATLKKRVNLSIISQITSSKTATGFYVALPPPFTPRQLPRTLKSPSFQPKRILQEAKDKMVKQAGPGVYTATYSNVSSHFHAVPCSTTLPSQLTQLPDSCL